MTTNYFTAIAAGAAANASTFNTPLGTLDAQITANTANAALAAATTAEVVAARDVYASLDARLDTLVAVGSNVSTQANGAANANQKTITVDNTEGFLPGAPISYTLVGGVIETNIVATVVPTTTLTVVNNIGTGGIADNTFIMVINLGALVSTGAVSGATSQAQGFTHGISIPGATTQYPLTLGTFNGSFLGVLDPTMEIGFNVEDGDARTSGVPAVWLAMEGNYANVGYQAGQRNYSEFYVSGMDTTGKAIRPIAFTWDNQDVDLYCSGQLVVSPLGIFNIVNTDGVGIFSFGGDGVFQVKQAIQFTATNPYIQGIANSAFGVVTYGHYVYFSNSKDGISFGADSDTNLYRSALNTLKTDHSLIVTGSLGLGSGVTMTEIAAPAAPAANSVVIYAVDNGGKTELCARFPSGAVQQIAIEP